MYSTVSKSLVRTNFCLNHALFIVPVTLLEAACEGSMISQANWGSDQLSSGHSAQVKRVKELARNSSELGEMSRGEVFGDMC